MDKLIWLPSKDIHGRNSTETLFIPNNTFEKVASGYSDGLQKYLSNLKPDIQKYLYMLLHAVGAEEYWGANSNSDSFPEEALKHEGDYGHKTFERYAKLYKHHINKDPVRSYGDVLHSSYDDNMHRVLLVVAVDRQKAPDICQKIEIDGLFPDVSMGCKVPWDECSICANRAKSPKVYCEHAKNDMGRIYPDGRKVFVRNIFPRFFDISYVFKGAEPVAKFMHKIAGDSSISESQRYFYLQWEPKLATDFAVADATHTVVPSSVLAEKVGYSIKDATMIKEVPAGESGLEPDNQVQSVLEVGLSRLREREKLLPSEVLTKLGSYPVREVLGTLTKLGIAIRPEEFQMIVLTKLGMKNEAEFFNKKNIVFSLKHASCDTVDPIVLNAFDHNHDIEKIASPFMDDRSDLQPHLFNRTMSAVHAKPIDLSSNLDKDYRKGETNVIPVLATVATLYMAYKTGLLESVQPIENAVRSVAEFVGVSDAPATSVIPIAMAAAAAVSGMQGMMRDPGGQVVNSPLDDPVKLASVSNLAIFGGSALAPYVYREHVANRARAGEPVGAMDAFVYRNPGATAIASVVAAANLTPKIREKAKQVSDFVESVMSQAKTVAPQAPTSVLSKAKPWIIGASMAYPFVQQEITRKKFMKGEEPSIPEMVVANNPYKASILAGIGAHKAIGKYASRKMNDNIIGKMHMFITKLGSDYSWDRLLEVVLNPAVASSKVASNLNFATASAGTVLGLAVLGTEEDA
jgi:hypothetical protein